VHQLAWGQHPTIWLCGSCAILGLMLRRVRSPWVRGGVLLVICGLTMNALVTSANAGTMPVVGMPATIHPASQIWQAATPETRLPLLADRARLGLFSIGDIVMLFGGSLVLAMCLGRASQDSGLSDLRQGSHRNGYNALPIKQQIPTRLTLENRRPFLQL
jgi:hypothetical protein